MMGWENFLQHVKFWVGIGNRIHLWHDRWCGERTLKEAFPDLFDYASTREATIESVLLRQNGGIDWNVSFVRNFNEWEMENVASFLNLLNSHIPASSDPDALYWHLKRDGGFDIRSFCE